MKQKRQYPLGSATGGMAFSAAVAIYLMFSLLVAIIIKAGSIEGTEGAIYLQCLVSPLAIAAFAVLVFVYAKQPAAELLRLKTKPKYILIGLLLIFGLLFSLSWVNDYLIRLFELMGYRRKESSIPDFSGWKILPVLFVVAVLPAMAEELLFRAIILNNTERDAGSIRTVLLVGMCFSLYHGNVEQTVYQFICGCLFALLAVRSRSVTPAVIIHFTNNALIIILAACGKVDMTTGALIISSGAQIALYVLSALSLIGATAWLVLDKTELVEAQPESVKKFFLGASVGIFAMAVVWITGLFI